MASPGFSPHRPVYSRFPIIPHNLVFMALFIPEKMVINVGKEVGFEYAICRVLVAAVRNLTSLWEQEKAAINSQG